MGVLSFTLHNFTVRSSLPETIKRASGEKQAERTQFEWPEKEERKVGLGTEKILIDLSSEQLRSNFPSYEKSICLTLPL